MPQDSFKDFVLDQLQGLHDLSARPMFGGHGLYSGARFFGIVYRGRLYFKTDDGTRVDYEVRGMRPFRPREGQTLRNYYEIPEELLDDPEALTAWARKAIATG